MKYYKITELKQGQTMRFDLKKYKIGNVRRMISYYGGDTVFKTEHKCNSLFVTRR